ncbi:MAG: bifunctional [glutamine synthetase] adenylyltransferase/[glutamine synthetase]-adenylyl-L-tyrosine phosphorylase [Mobiluncus porci]|uniref:bifunctional [glutamine synthetase] adenylyltransferase/[glutamine synthetase]-adenylyl-L-tyrosine phosphorylase n=1 Tax=Mobiluncus porci TaxID=2652278 RepID=UPI0023F47610|nr:bifunctional [glutamine synthetase] adenylyltransferase/[glutamine synthetase]-adenylyl-L-tyrosine phosphorylase [Mobiluncus porci]MDD7541501.1 bifunctional [glutamine synthetase] adenylyltransferase/[glutamine synthetase]-adenylyl-L-tyrosine phosphorylase [Mobiluncus porci]MDY5748486.1 bifunctional [glutamine synthetase] adenylyltransferase/[glutamine synthetase]-adenylyl-L-tyrosine phosphorylase [Mobiluncus porci]
MAREYSLTTALLTAGIEEVERAKKLLTAIIQLAPAIDSEALVDGLGEVADPDLALLSLERILNQDSRTPRGARELLQSRQVGGRTLRLLGYSEFFGNYLATHPEILEVLEDDPEPSAFAKRFLESVDASNLADEDNPCWVAGENADVLALRRAYYTQLAQIAATDLSHVGVESAKAQFESTSSAISWLVDAALEAALALVRRDLDPQGEVAFTVIAMGKTGAQELNYISDVDVIYVAGPRTSSQLPPTLDAQEALERATEMAIALGAYCSASREEPALWVLDTALRPEGKDGALVRQLESHLEYYERWAKAWEFQALLKARPAAGDRELGENYLQKIQPFVWKAVEHEGFVDETRAMRRRVEQLLDPKKAGREIKLGIGGLRDVEFTVQLLQLVHGRVDESLRVRSTLDGLNALVAGGYIGRDQGEELADHYRFLRVIEHRSQLGRMRRTHLFPQGAELRRVAKSIDPLVYQSGSDLEEAWETIRSRVRALHEEIYYRPLLPAMAKLTAGEASLNREDAASRLQVIGYRDPKRALDHIEALTSGVSRRAAIQRQLLPVLLGWFAGGVNPDEGLLAFRQVSEALGDTHWYLRLLRDSGTAAQRLTTLLSSSPLIAQLLPGNPDAVAWLDDDADLAPRSREELETEILASFERQPDLNRRAQRLRAVRGRELLRCAMVDVLQGIDPMRGATTLGAVGQAVLAGALDLAIRALASDSGTPVRGGSNATGNADRLLTTGPHADHLIVAMGRFGGDESGYATDADVVFYYVPLDPSEEGSRQAASEARNLVAKVRKILGGTDAGAWEVDTDLRPEGKSGPAAKDLGTLAEYFDRWAAAWERQALLRANPIVGTPEIRKRFLEIVDPIRYSRPPTDKEIKEIRRLKARMETERLGASTLGGLGAGGGSGSQANWHVKLGPGGLSDVEWCVQLLQLRFAESTPSLRTTSTRQGLQAAWSAGLLDPAAARVLDEAWMLATRIRAANVLGSGRTKGKRLDMVATDRLLISTAALLGYSEGSHQDLLEDWMRTARLARAVVERVFYE